MARMPAAMLSSQAAARQKALLIPLARAEARETQMCLISRGDVSGSAGAKRSRSFLASGSPEPELPAVPPVHRCDSQLPGPANSAPARALSEWSRSCSSGFRPRSNRPRRIPRQPNQPRRTLEASSSRIRGPEGHQSRVARRLCHRRRGLCFAGQCMLSACSLLSHALVT